MLKSEKQKVVDTASSIFKEHSSIIVTKYQGLDVGMISDLRSELAQNGCKYKIIKNSLSKIAIKDSGVCDISDFFTGPVAIGYSNDPVSLAKGLVKFAKDNDNLKIVGGIIDNQIVNQSEVNDLSKLASIEEIRAKLLYMISGAGGRLAATLNAPALQLARVIGAYVNK